MVEVSIASLNVAIMTLLIATPVAPFDGLVEATCGGALSGDEPVVKLE